MVKESDSDNEYEFEDDELSDDDIEDIEEVFTDIEGDVDITDTNIDQDNDTDICNINDFEHLEPSIEKKILDKEHRISSNRLTKYEMVRILGERTEQLTKGAKPLIRNYQGLSYDKIAIEEFKKNMTPFKIKRKLPNGMYEIWELSELIKDHLLNLI
jgi:DNA-directed RNA polymerase subunit K/omega